MTKKVTVDDFTRAESDMYFGSIVRITGGLGRWNHHRQVMDVGNQTVIRANRDTLYSSAVFDLDAGSVSITLPDTGGRFMSAIAINQDHYVSPAVYAPRTFEVSREDAGTRYVLIGVRTLVDPGRQGDLEAVHALQDGIRTEQAEVGHFDVPEWDEDRRNRIRSLLVSLAGFVPDAGRTFGGREEVDPVRHLIGTASGWGGNRDADATYVTVTPERNDGVTPHSLTVRDVPVDGFWSIAVYNSDGYFEPNELGAYGVNSFTAAADPDGAVTIRFGGDPDAPNYVPITDGWNYWVRLYRPRPEVLEGTWLFPEAAPHPSGD